MKALGAKPLSQLKKGNLVQLIFTRHGESQANTLGIISNRDLAHPLTEKGRTQGKALAESLVAAGIHSIYSSPILRAQQTAELVAKHLGLPFHTSSALREFDCGVMEGRGNKAAWTAHHNVVAAWDAGRFDERIEDGESFNDVRARFIPFTKTLVAEHGDNDGAVLLISHGGVLQQMLPVALNNVNRSFTQEHGLSNCAVVMAEVKDKVLTCIRWNTLQLADH